MFISFQANLNGPCLILMMVWLHYVLIFLGVTFSCNMVLECSAVQE